MENQINAIYQVAMAACIACAITATALATAVATRNQPAVPSYGHTSAVQGRRRTAEARYKWTWRRGRIRVTLKKPKFA